MAANTKEQESFFELETPPTDGITKVQFFHRSNKCVVASWDTSVSIHTLATDNNKINDNSNDNNSETKNEFSKAEQVTAYTHEAGVLDVALTSDDSTIYSVGCDFVLRSFDLNDNSNNNNENNNNNTSVIGYHSQPIRCVEYSEAGNCVITGSWDKHIKLWDARQGNANNNNNNNNSINNSSAFISKHELSGKIFSMSMQSGNDGYNLIVATSDRQVYIYDIRDMSNAIQTRESSLKHQTRTVVWHPNNKQYVLASIEGRVAVEYLDTDKTVQSKKYAFKCHRQSGADSKSKTQIVFPVNAVAFHPIYHTFATGGGDGVVNVWDGENKKRICQFPSVNTSVASVDFNFDGSLMAIAKSYTWEKGDLSNKENLNNYTDVKDNVIFRKIGDSQAKPKIKKKKT